jgi:hypothetical protein
MPAMADGKKPRGKRKADDAPPKGKDRHAPYSMVRLAPDLHRQLKKLARRNRRPLAWELRRILEEALQAEGLWPPSDEETDPG